MARCVNNDSDSEGEDVKGFSRQRWTYIHFQPYVHGLAAH